ncbi:hypothetical protein [Luteolibacter luteus]|uniref:Beta-hexosaminidase bacterial type N-terminal domain-containing protein n=1 Tax=Luteolibacter luteus TaxID=2728835 RepID=A0A858RM63_9BACT|nr:hypothetical protein [Luteolibacter luteus]QJE98476.1 hypothetical protein HHL09_22710 [Luteolibacter luteus]
MRFLCCWIIALFSTALCRAESPRELPMGPETAPLPASHFPSAAHAVVWRNWTLVPPAKLAEILESTESEVVSAAVSMGLPAEASVSPEWARRGYITLLRRNWHLLPYEQLLPLLGMSQDQLAFSLREDDFLFIKLGSRKPRCPHVTMPVRTEEIRAAEGRIGRLVKERFGALGEVSGEAPFSFIHELSQLPASGMAKPTGDWRKAPPRIIYSYFATFGDPLADGAPDPFPDGLLARLAAEGVNGVWLHAVLQQLAPGGPDFPDFGRGSEGRLENLKRLVDRAGAQGIAIYLYLNEPRAMPAEFYAKRPEMAGVTDGDHRALCTSDPKVRRWLEDASAHVFTKVPSLGGVITISGSENLTHCASHGRQQECPRCGKRDADEITAEANAVLAAGVHRAAPDARFIVWDWGWHGHGEAPGVISRLPKDVWLQSVSEWQVPFNRGGIDGTVGEYSLSVVGPGSRAKKHWEWARQAGLKTSAKLQLNNTWELAPVPWLPVLDLVARHCENVGKEKVDGLLLSWSLGGHPSPNLQVARRFFSGQGEVLPPVDDVLTAVAVDRYGAEAGPWVREAWAAFSRAFSEYPYCGSVIYQGPQHVGPANLPLLTPSGLPSSMVGFPYDDLDGWRGPYPPEILASQFEKVATGWAAGIAKMDEAIRAASAADASLQAALLEDKRLAEAAGCYLSSAAVQVRYLMARSRWLAADDPEEKDKARREMLGHLARWGGEARKLYPLAKADSRIGFEASNHYFSIPQDLVETVIAVEWASNQLSSSEDAKAAPHQGQ